MLCAKLSGMTALLAQTTSGEWHDGWQLVMSAIGVAVIVVIAVVGWLHKQSKADISDMRSDMKERFNGVEKCFDTVDKRFDAVDRRIDRLDSKIDAMYHLLLSQSMGSATQQTQPDEPPQQTSAEAERTESVRTSVSEMV